MSPDRPISSPRRPASRTVYHLLLASALLAAFALLALRTVRWSSTFTYGSVGSTDWLCYWGGGQLLLQGESPYDHPKLRALEATVGWTLERAQPMWNPPHLLILIYPFLPLSFFASTVAWLATTLLLLALAVVWIWRQVAGPAATERVGLAFVATALFAPVFFLVVFGQVTPIVLIGLVGFWRFASRRRDFVAGMFLALTTIKPHIVYLVWIAVAYWVWKEKRWRVVTGVVAVLAACYALLAAAYPNAISGFRFVLENPPLDFFPSSLGGYLRYRIDPDERWIQFAPTLIGATAFGAYLLWRRPPIDWDAVIGPLALLSVATGAYGWHFDQTILLIAYLQTVAWLTDDRTTVARSRIVGILIVLALISGIQMLQALPARYQLVDFFWPPWALGAIYWHAYRTFGPGVAASKHSQAVPEEGDVARR